MQSFFNFERTALQNWLSDSVAGTAGKEVVRARQLFEAVYKQNVRSAESLVGIAKSVQARVQTDLNIALPVAVESSEQSQHDGSIKFIFTLLSDGARIESVLIPERGRLTQCLSTQVGCAQACRFCQTGRMGLARQLTTAEIVGQVLLAEQWRAQNSTGISSQMNLYGRISNIVFMGMGEPLDNLQSVLNSIAIFTDPAGLNLSPNKITVSTVGLLPALEQFLSQSKASLALSLHSPFSAERSRMMPVNDRHPMSEVLAVLRKHAQNYGRKFMIQYTLIRGFNDTPAHAQALVAELAGIPVLVNLIPLNEHDGAAFRRPDLNSVFVFQNVLKAAGMVATVRLSKGRDIQAACGQLIKKKSAPQKSILTEA